VEDFLRLQIWFVVYIGSACLLALWLLPSLVPLVTPIPYRRFVGSLQTALLTAFAAGDHFVVLPMIVEANRKLLEEQGVSSQDADGTIGVAVPLLFNFPHAGKILTLAFFPFAAWFSGTDLGANQWLTLTTAGVLSLFGNINAAVPFLLDLLQLPADLFNLFTMSSVLNVRFGALVAAMHTAVLSMLVAASLLGRTRLHAGRLVRTGVLAAAVLVAFVLGCSFSFEEALLEDGIELRHITCNATVPMYRTSIATVAAGPFHGPMVVSMRPMKPAAAIRAIQITTRFPAVHGAPVHIGKPELIGIKDLAKPDYGNAVTVKSDEIPVFWACGVTPQSVVATVKPEFCITHYPGTMLVTDRKNSEFAIM
jgi:hypothetical protein